MVTIDSVFWVGKENIEEVLNKMSTQEAQRYREIWETLRIEDPDTQELLDQAYQGFKQHSCPEQDNNMTNSLLAFDWAPFEGPKTTSSLERQFS